MRNTGDTIFDSGGITICERIVAILLNYARFKGSDVSEDKEIEFSGFHDVSD